MSTTNWSRKHRKQIVVLSISGWCAFYMAFILPMHFQHQRQIAAMRSSGLGSVSDVGWEPISYWQQSSVSNLLSSPTSMARGASAVASLGREADSDRASPTTDNPRAFEPGSPAHAGVAGAGVAKIVRNAALDLEVRSPTESAEKIRALAESKGGYLVSSEVSGDHLAPGGAVTVRVPASRYEETRDQLKKLAVRVEAEKVEAKDMTVDYADKEARLRSLRAQAAQYLAIMRRATTVKDTLEASGKLNEVRGQIEQQQAEFAALSKQVETVAIAVALHAEADAQVFGLYWRPMYEFKLAARDGLESLTNYAVFMTAALFKLPAVLLWLATILVTAAIGWRGLRWGWKKLAPQTTTAQ